MVKSYISRVKVMPWIPVFLDENDARELIRWLNDEPDIAFIINDGPNRWKAVHTVDRLPDGRYGLWQHTGESLPLLRQSGLDEAIENPWGGWQEDRTGTDPTVPYFGASHPSVFWLELRTRHRPYSTVERENLPMLCLWWTGKKDILALSGFEWIGNRHRKAPQSTHRCWRRLKGWVGRSSNKLTARRTSFWAFPSALAKLRSGMDYYANGFDLGESLRTKKG
jgi:hypothetical protein